MDAVEFSKQQAAATKEASNLPDNFHMILVQICREVMTHRPLNVYNFCADILEHDIDRRTLAELSATGKLYTATFDYKAVYNVGICGNQPLTCQMTILSNLFFSNKHQEQSE